MSSSRLGESPSLKTTYRPRLDEDSTKQSPMHFENSLRRAILALARVSIAQNSKPLVWVRYHAQNSWVSSRPRLDECLSPERETMLLNPFPGRIGECHEPKPKVRLYNSRLGEVDLLGRDLQGFESVHALNSPQPCPIHTTNIRK